MADLIGIQIKDLQVAPSVSTATDIPIQRSGVTKAEKTSFQQLVNWVVSTSTFANSVNTSVNNEITAHVNDSDPHGDRNYSDTSMSTHTSATDPHGDRAFATSSVNTSMSSHLAASDPHGDRAYSNTQVSNHISAVDPHGDRAFATTQANNAITTANTYTNTTINSEFDTRVGDSIAPLVAGKVPNSYLNQELSFSAYSSFPGTGLATNLYIDTTGKDIYYWDGTNYYNLTPEVDVGNLDLNTDIVPPGVNADRQYYTTAIAGTLNAKLDNVINETLASSTSVYSRRAGNVVYLKNLQTSFPLSITNTSTDIQILDNTYTYTAMNTANTYLTLSELYKTDVLTNYNTTNIYHITGEVFVYCPQVSSGTDLVNEYNTFTVDARYSTIGITQDVPIVTSANFDSTGTTLTGTGLANTTLEIYDETYTSLGTTAINTLGNFSKTFSPVRDDGKPIYLYIKTPANERSDKYTIYEPNLGTLRQITNISVTSDGTIVRGVAERLVDVTILDNLDVQIGTGTASSTGFFEITLTAPVVDGATIKFDSVNSYSTTSATLTYTVDFTTINAPYSIRINNDRTSITGKSIADSTVHLYDNSATLIDSFVVDATGNFIGSLTGISTSTNDFKVRTEETSVFSAYSDIVVPTYITLNNPPPIIPVLVDSTFDSVYKSIIKRNATSFFDFDFEIDEFNSIIKLKATNTLSKNAKWKAIFKINITSID